MRRICQEEEQLDVNGKYVENSDSLRQIRNREREPKRAPKYLLPVPEPEELPVEHCSKVLRPPAEKRPLPPPFQSGSPYIEARELGRGGNAGYPRDNGNRPDRRAVLEIPQCPARKDKRGENAKRDDACATLPTGRQAFRRPAREPQPRYESRGKTDHRPPPLRQHEEDGEERDKREKACPCAFARELLEQKADVKKHE